MRVKLPGGKVFSHLLASGLDERWVLEESLNFLSGGVAAHVLFLQHFPEVHPVLDAVDDVLKYLILSPRSVVGPEESVPEGAFLLGHFCSQPPYPLCFTEDSYPKIMNSDKEGLHLESARGPPLPLITEPPRRAILGYPEAQEETVLLYTATLAQKEPRELDLHQEEVQNAPYHSTLGA